MKNWWQDVHRNYVIDNLGLELKVEVKTDDSKMQNLKKKKKLMGCKGSLVRLARFEEIFDSVHSHSLSMEEGLET